MSDLGNHLKLSTLDLAMGIPEALVDMSNIHYYQGIIIAEVSVTLGIYVILKIIHYLKWGANDEGEKIQKAPIEENKSGGPEDEDSLIKVPFCL
jgi:hypothetical protein